MERPVAVTVRREDRVPLSDVVADCVRRWFRDTLEEAKGGDATMQVLVGQMYQIGYGVPRSEQKVLLSLRADFSYLPHFVLAFCLLLFSTVSFPLEHFFCKPCALRTGTNILFWWYLPEELLNQRLELIFMAEASW